MTPDELARLRGLVTGIDTPLHDVNARVLSYQEFRSNFAPLDLARTVLAMAEEIARLRAALVATCGYMRNASIGLDVGATKRITRDLLEEGCKRTSAALEGAPR